MLNPTPGCHACACDRCSLAWCEQVSLAGSNFDTLVALYAFTGTGFGSLLAFNDDCAGSSTLQSCLVYINVEPDSELRIQVSGVRPLGGVDTVPPCECCQYAWQHLASRVSSVGVPQVDGYKGDFGNVAISVVFGPPSAPASISTTRSATASISATRSVSVTASVSRTPSVTRTTSRSPSMVSPGAGLRAVVNSPGGFFAPTPARATPPTPSWHLSCVCV